MSFDLASAKDVDTFVRSHLEQLAKMFTETGALVPHAAVFITLEPKTFKPLPSVGVMHVIAPDMSESNSNKTAFADSLRRYARLTRAVGILLCFEAWTLEGISEEERRSVKGIDQHPDRGEAIFASLDHLAFSKNRQWQARIHRDAAGKGTVDAFEERFAVKSEGRFSSLFPRDLYS